MMSGVESERTDDEPTGGGPPIVAIAPRVRTREEREMTVSASPAFKNLDELYNEGKLSTTKMTMLKATYTNLHDILIRTCQHESALVAETKAASCQLDELKSHLDREDSYPEGHDSEVARLRKESLKLGNNVMQSDDRRLLLEYKTAMLEEERKLLESEYSRMPKEGERERRLKDLESSTIELRKEIGSRHLETKNLKEDVDAKKHGMQIISTELAEQLEELNVTRTELAAINSLPSHIMKECDKFVRAKSEMLKQHDKADEQIAELKAAVQRLHKKQTGLVEDKQKLWKEMESKQRGTRENEIEHAKLNKDLNYAKQKEVVFVGNRATLDMNLRHLNFDRRSIKELYTRKSREKEREVRSLKKTELHMHVCTDALQHTQSLYDKVKCQVQMQPKDDGSQLARRQELQKEVVMLTRTLTQQDVFTALETSKVEHDIHKLHLMHEQKDYLAIEAIELTRLADIKTDEREQKARDLMRAQLRFNQTEEDLKTKQVQIQDQKKKLFETQVKRKDFAKIYDVMKNDRNKMVNLIQTSTQKTSEMREKIMILKNEFEILRTAAMKKDGQLQKQNLKHVSVIVLRDTLRNEVGKQNQSDEELREKREQQNMDIAKLNLLINQAEEQMVALRNRYEVTVQERNDRGIKMIERNEEVAVFYEKINIQNQMLRYGNEQLNARAQELRYLEMHLAQEKRDVELLRKTVPQKEAKVGEVETLNIQLKQCQEYMLELERQLEDADNCDRARVLGGHDPSPAQLKIKLEDMESRLAVKEEKLLEKDLVLQQACRLSDRVLNKVHGGRDDTLVLAKKVNELQSKIKATTRQMMSLVSELSMNQASAVRLQREVRQREDELRLCYDNMEAGQPPLAQIHDEWLRTERDTAARAAQRLQAKMVEEEIQQHTIGGSITTAEPRPNAYLPDDDVDLPIPRPYGISAPFRPNEPGANMRHIRKPQSKPIEI